MSQPRRRRQVLGMSLSGLAVAGAACADTAPPAAPTPARPFDVRAFGAAGDGVAHDTAAIQATIDAAHRGGGGTVLFPAGRYLSGTISLRSRVTLHLSPGAVLLGSTAIAAYPAKDFPARDLDIGGHSIWALVHAEDAEQVAIEGDGVIDGNGWAFPRVPVGDPEVPTRPRPRMIFFKNCRGVSLRDVTLRESGMWTVHLALCEAIRIRGLRVTSSLHLNQDGIVLDSCHAATISDCHVDTLDDALVLKSSFPAACSDVTITNCVLRSSCAGVKLGTQSLGGFRNIAISNCALHDCRLGGLKFQTVDGGDLENVAVQNIVMRDVAAPLSFRRGHRGFDYGFREVPRPRPVGRLANVSVSQVRAVLPTDAAPLQGHTMSIAGLPGYPVEDVSLEDLDIVFPGGGTLEQARRAGIPERETAYPEHDMFGVLPAYGLWVRHASRLAARDVRFTLATDDARPALVCDDVDDLELTGFRAPTSGTEPLIRLGQTRDALLQGCRPTRPVDTFLQVDGDGSREIALTGNDLRRARRIVTGAEDGAGVVTHADTLGHGA